MTEVRFTLSYEGADSAKHLIDLYDVSQALIGFQRSLALTTHLLLNDEIITQAPALKGAHIYAVPAEPGSWKLTAAIAMTATGLYHLGTTPNNSPLGHLMFSLYDYVISESLGYHVDYNKSLGQLAEEAKSKQQKLPEIKEHQVDALIEKCSRAITEMHRPIVKSETATHCTISGNYTGRRNHPLNARLTRDSFEFIHETVTSEAPNVFEGRISSYNSNTYKGRIYIAAIGRPVTFELEPHARSNRSVQVIATSLFHNALNQRQEPGSLIHIVAFENTSRTGTLKSLTISRVSDKPFN